MGSDQFYVKLNVTLMFFVSSTWEPFQEYLRRLAEMYFRVINLPYCIEFALSSSCKIKKELFESDNYNEIYLKAN